MGVSLLRDPPPPKLRFSFRVGVPSNKDEPPICVPFKGRKKGHQETVHFWSSIPSAPRSPPANQVFKGVGQHLNLAPTPMDGPGLLVMTLNKTRITPSSILPELLGSVIRVFLKATMSHSKALQEHRHVADGFHQALRQVTSKDTLELGTSFWFP